MFSTLSLSLLNRKVELGRKFSCLGPQQSVAIAENIVQVIGIKREMLQFREVLSICKIKSWSELTMAIFTWQNMGELCFGQKYTVTSRLGGKDLDIGYTFRTDFSICE